MEAKIRELSVYLIGWINYCGIANQYQQCVELDQWIRRRIRMCYWKQWRKARTKIGNLIRLGVPRETAIKSGLSGKSYWRSSKSPTINMALSLECLEQQGLYALREDVNLAHTGKARLSKQQSCALNLIIKGHSGNLRFAVRLYDDGPPNSRSLVLKGNEIFAIIFRLDM